jgi:uncharacterized protein (TIGR03382 family)
MRSTTPIPWTATALTLMVIFLLPVAALVGLFVPGFYRDPPWVVPQARGQDLVTLVVAEPLLIAAVALAARGRVTARLLWAGTLGYVLYTYALFSYTAHFNALFLVYVAVFSASAFALLDLLVHLDVARVREAGKPTMPVRAIAGFLAAVGAFFLVAWLGQIIPALISGTAPASVTLAQTPTNAVHVQDLAFILPLFFLAALWLWRRRAWGYALAAIMLVIADIMAIALLSMGAFAAAARLPDALDLMWLWAALTATSLGFTALFAAHLRQPMPAARPEAPAHAADPRSVRA